MQNITDVDDKIIVKAREKGVTPKDLARAFETEHLKDMKKMGITSVKEYARATEYIPQIISQIKRLMEKGFAYQLPDGIYFDISKFEGYGKLSGRSALQAEDSVSRIDYSAEKKNRGDFCLWKFTDETHQGLPTEAGAAPDGTSLASWREPSWPSPFGAGRPGWHIEDTAITESFFGAQYDIHGGARDLIFPHHEAEVAQMEAISGKSPLAKYWLHTGFLTVEDQKMSKSLGNGIAIQDFLKRYTVQQLRFLIAKNLWRSPMNYSEAIMIEVRSSLERIEEFLRKVKSQTTRSKTDVTVQKKVKTITAATRDQFFAALADDFNTPQAFAAMFECIKEMNILLSHNKLAAKTASDISAFFKEIDSIFGIIDTKKLKVSAIPAEITKLLNDRENYRKAAEWEKADQVRKEIEKYGYVVEDTQSGPMLKKM